jgi:hypothetical protein
VGAHEARSLKWEKFCFVLSPEAAMRNIPEHPLRQSRVTAVFEDSALSFILAKGATLEDLSHRLGNLGRRHTGMPVAIIVKFGSSKLSPDKSTGVRTASRT